MPNKELCYTIELRERVEGKLDMTYRPDVLSARLGKTNAIKLGCYPGYAGGSVFYKFSDAEEFLESSELDHNWQIYGVKINWVRDTYPAPEGSPYRLLSRNAEMYFVDKNGKIIKANTEEK